MSNDDYLTLDQLNDRIAILEDNIRQLIEQAAAASGEQNEARIALQSGRVASFFDDISGNAKFAQTNKQYRLIIPSPVIDLEGTAFAIRKGYFYDDLQALDIMVENYVNTGKLKAGQAKYGLPNPADFTK